ncbi:MAG: hypothetical protein F4090_00300 [Nitrospira sp. SB0672_bin_25]|nr:hypothetical protein [Nitrospira sp. SB0666_bin_27]MYJ53363.1 hypothetical protein [Nitrospira sp. SB0672_bin_25]
MKWILSLLIFVIVSCLLVASPVEAGSGLYLSSELGANFASGLDNFSRDDDRASKCDEYINPYFAMVPGCTDPVHGGDASKAVYDGAKGILAGAAVGYRLKDAYPGRFWGGFRVEMEYFFRESEYDQSVTSAATRAQTIAKRLGETALSAKSVGSITSHNLFGNVFFDWINGSRFTPYVGFGIGVGFTAMDWNSMNARNSDPTAITSIPDDLCNGISGCDVNEIRRNLAGTTTTEQTVLKDTLFGWQVLFGVDYALTESVSLGVKGRWVNFNTFRDGGSWDRLRSHESNLRLDGSEPVTYRLMTDDIDFFGISLNLKYHF